MEGKYLRSKKLVMEMARTALSNDKEAIVTTLRDKAFLGASSAQAFVSSSASAAVTSAPRCPPVWDSIHCWPPVEAGKMPTLPCREVFGRLNYTQHDVRWGAGQSHRYP
ncbi:hypothetical protein MRX96_027267 [Rhipicephalus microplus]